MKLLAHISDVHFGREDPGLVTGLLQALSDAKPDVIVVSGDLTQRARKAQFRKARQFLRSLPKVPRLVVPGNHDVSATNLYDRLARPLKRYRKFITSDLSPFVENEEFAIAGINTVRLLARKDGRINRKQAALACDQLSRAPATAVRIVVTHHPMDLPMEDRTHALVVRAKMAMSAFSDCGVDLFLSGHLHTGQAIVTATRYGKQASTQPYQSAVVAQAGTAVSTRTRGEANTWNLIHLHGREVDSILTVEQIVWDAATQKFTHGTKSNFQKYSSGWAVQVPHL